MRQQIELMEKNLKKIIANNLKEIMSRRGYSQAKLAEISKIPASTLSDIMTEKFLVTAGRIQQLADALHVPKSEIDPSFDTDFIEKIKEAKSEYTSIPAHLDVGLDLFDEMYFEGKRLSKKDKEKIKHFIRGFILSDREISNDTDKE